MREERKSDCVNTRYSVVIYMANARFMRCMVILDIGRKKRNMGGAS
jgi:hypothetical protein